MFRNVIMQEEQRSLSSICLFSFSSSIDGSGDLTFSWNNHGWQPNHHANEESASKVSNS
jgi:hypothetical protein